MPYREVVYNRERLYAEVWSQPMTKLASQYGVSDVALRKTCKSMGIPLPPQGHWVTAESGRAKRPRLPPLKEGQAAERRATVPVQPEPHQPSAKELAFESAIRDRRDCEYRRIELPFKIEVVEGAKVHPLAARARAKLLKDKPDYRGQVQGGGLDIEVSQALVDRTIRFISTLSLAVEKVGHKVFPTESYEKRCRFVVDGEVVRFDVTEKVKRVPYEKSPSRLFFAREQKWAYVPSGELRLHLRVNGRGERKWEDKGGRRLEEQINDVFHYVLQAAADCKVYRARAVIQARLDQQEREEQARIEERRQRERARLEEKRRQEKAKVDALLDASVQWERVQNLRRFIQIVEETSSRDGGPIATAELGVWVQWANSVADAHDPLKAWTKQR